MRKVVPEDVWTDFADQLDQQAGFYVRSCAVLTAHGDKKLATENYILTLGVLFEGFVNDLIFAYANRDCSKIMQHLEASIRQTLASNQKATAAFDAFAEFRTKKHLSKAELRQILDPLGRNISFANFAAIEEKAKQWLIREHANRFTRLTGRQKAIIDLTISFRNNLEHRSKSSLDRLNQVLNLGVLQPTGLRRGINRVQQPGSYLRSIVDGTPRAELLASFLRSSSQEIAR